MDTPANHPSEASPAPVAGGWASGWRRLRRVHAWMIRPPAGLDPRFTDFYPLSNYVHCMGLFAHVCFLLLFAWLNIPFLVIFNTLSIGLFALTSWLSRRGDLDRALLLGGLEVATHQGVAVAFIGLDAGFQNYLFVLVVGTLFYTHIELWVRVTMALLPVFWYGALLVWGIYAPPLQAVSQPVLVALALGNALMFVGILMGMAIYFQYAVDRARARAERMSASKTLFLANMSHELRTPLNAILGFGQILSRSADILPAHRSRLDSIHRSGEHLLGLINRILDMSKLEEGQIALHEAPFELQRLLADVQDMFSLQAQAKGLTLTTECAPALEAVWVGDALRLRQVLINLVGNALKFTHVGGIRLLVSLAARQPAQGRRLRLEVHDSGVGISKVEQGDLFQIFTQTESGRQSGHGTGLGLALSRRLVELMGGEIGLRSKPGVGSQFWFEVNLQALQDGAMPRAEAVGRVRPALASSPMQPVIPLMPEPLVAQAVTPAFATGLDEPPQPAPDPQRLLALREAVALADYERCESLLLEWEPTWPPARVWWEHLQAYRFDLLQEALSGFATPATPANPAPEQAPRSAQGADRQRGPA